MTKDHLGHDPWLWGCQELSLLANDSDGCAEGDPHRLQMGLAFSQVVWLLSLLENTSHRKNIHKI